MSRVALVVDDSTSIRQLVAFTLTRAGFDVVEAGNGQQALEQLATVRPALIVTDLNMPVMDGISFIRAARQHAHARFTPILMLTTESQEQKKLEGKAAGATGWIVKPFDPDRMMKVIQMVGV